MNRRTFLASGVASATAGIAGCAGFSLATGGRTPPLVENRPDAVYIPSHVEEMEMVGTADAGDVRVAVTYSYPHRFWTVEQEADTFEAREVSIRTEDVVHLMASVWDPETGVVIPDTGLSMKISNDEGLVSQEVVYPMLSQQMGFHYGANFPLDGNDVYDLTVSVGAPNVKKFGSLAGQFTEPASTTVEFDYREAKRNDIGYTRFGPDRRGQRDAIQPMSMGSMPVGRVPKSAPGTLVGSASLGDLHFRGSVVDDDRFDDGPYFVVTAGTPYNRLVVPGMALSASVPGDDALAFSGRLRPGLDADVGFHYGAPLSRSVTGPVELRLEIPPQVARHEGYETAFLETGTVTLTD